MTLVLDRRRVGDGRGTGDGMVVVVVVRMLVLESSSLGSCRRRRAGAWVVVGSRGCSRWSGRGLPHDGIDQKPNSPKTIWMSPWPGTSRLKRPILLISHDSGEARRAKGSGISLYRGNISRQNFLPSSEPCDSVDLLYL